MQQQGGSRYGVPPPEMAVPFSSGAPAPQQPRTARIPGSVEYLPKLQQLQGAAEEASPISSRPPPLQVAVPRPPVSIFEDFGVDVGATGGSFPDEEALGAGEEAERTGVAGNRWPRQETLALLKIRSEMDTAFRDATVKGPLWDDVSRKLADLGYSRSAKKCKEKFENVHKYYKRTKEGRAGRQDGKSYRFFSQLEAIQSSSGVGVAAAATSPFPFAPSPTSFPAITSALGSVGVSPPPVNTSSSLFAPGSTMKGETVARIQPPTFPGLGRPVPVEAAAPSRLALEVNAAAARISLYSNTSSSSGSDTDGEETEEGVAGELQGVSRKRKREEWPVGRRKMMAFFDGLMKQVMERQELMQQRFFETIEKREQDRMIRDEAWKRQEMARLNREYELMAQERSIAASRDAAIISFLEKLAGSPANQKATASAPFFSPTPAETSPAAALPSSPRQLQKPTQATNPVELQLHPPAMECESNLHERNEFAPNQLSVSSEPASTTAAMSDLAEAMGGGSLDAVSPSSSSRWPKTEVLALIKLRSGLDTRYLDAGPKGPLWEEISLEMKKLGYSRNAKRCKEKWENINKYFKKVKESNKKRPEDAKTCPYFHELDAIYRKKQLSSGGGVAIAGIAAEQQEQLDIAKSNPQQIREPLRPLAPTSGPKEQGNSNGENNSTFMKNGMADGGNHESCGDQIQRSNGAGIPQVFFGGAPIRGGGAGMKKPEDIIRELMEQQNQPRRVENDYDKLCRPVDNDTMNHEYDDEDEDYDDDDEDDEGRLRYEIQFQRQAVGATAAPGARGGNATGKVANAASSAGSFLAMVQ